MTDIENDQIRTSVREHYAGVATQGVQTGQAGCCAPATGCCGANPEASLALGYTAEDLAQAPDANLGLGCGNPQAIAALKPGESVLDLGSGAGFDSFLAARQIGKTGRVIGVDMTPEMLAKARVNAEKLELSNVEFRLGEIERLPVADNQVDVILSNCVINLSPDKPAVFREAFRVLRRGGRLAISDVVATRTLPSALASDLAVLAGCVAGAALVDDLRQMLADAGFEQIRIDVKPGSREFVKDWFPGSGAEDYVASASIEAIKPSAAACCAPGCCA